MKQTELNKFIQDKKKQDKNNLMSFLRELEHNDRKQAEKSIKK